MKRSIGMLALAVIAGLAGMAKADSVTISGSALKNLKYVGDPGDSQYVSGTPDVAQLSTPDSGLNGDDPAVFVKAANVGLPSLGTLGSFSASFDLYSSTGPGEPYWLTYLYAPGGGYIGVVSFGGPDLNASAQIHVFYDYATTPLSSDDYWGDTLAQLDSTVYGATTFGQLGVYETAVEIGDYNNGEAIIPASADLDSITITTVPIPASVWGGMALLGGLGMLGCVKRLRRQIV